MVSLYGKLISWVWMHLELLNVCMHIEVFVCTVNYNQLVEVHSLLNSIVACHSWAPPCHPVDCKQRSQHWLLFSLRGKLIHHLSRPHTSLVSKTIFQWSLGRSCGTSLWLLFSGVGGGGSPSTAARSWGTDSLNALCPVPMARLSLPIQQFTKMVFVSCCWRVTDVWDAACLSTCSSKQGNQPCFMTLELHS